jgi:hypothetical protein
MNDTVIAAAARAVAEAEAGVARTAAALRQAEAHRQHVADRLADIEAGRATVVSRRAAGDQRHDDGALVALAQADIEGLNALLTNADAAVAAVRGPHEDAERAVAAARFSLDREKDGAVEGALIAHARQLDDAMLRTIGELETAAARLGRTGRPVWGVSPVLYAKVRALASARGEL